MKSQDAKNRNRKMKANPIFVWFANSTRLNNREKRAARAEAEKKRLEKS